MAKGWVCALCFVAALAFLIGCCNAQDCSSLNNCSGNGQCENGACVCHDGFGFEDCSMTTTNCPSFCSGHGKCLNGTCICSDGYGGEACNQVVQTCAFNCSGHGICNQGACTCFPGLWEGESCNVEIYNCPAELNDCNGHGDCAPTDPQDTQSAWVCSCDNGFCGSACDLVCGGCPANCTGHGLCIGGKCECEDGFGGDECGLVAAIAGCPNNCSGHGLCVQKSGGGFQCECHDCFSGDACLETTVFCPGNCSGHGMCGCDGKCNCQEGFSGEACQDAASTCEEHAFCSGNGDCYNHTCRCKPGFAGSKCNLACHAGPGNNTVGCGADLGHGLCVAVSETEATCQCVPEFEGIACEKNTTSGMFDEYLNGWNPIGTIVIMMAAVCVVAFVGGLVINYVHGKRGINAVPGVNSIRSKVKGADYEGQRNESNY